MSLPISARGAPAVSQAQLGSGEAGVERAPISLRLVAPPSAAGQLVNLRHKPIYVGSDPQANLRADHPAMSPLHCVLLRRGNLVFVRDLGSDTGTFVNGEPVAGEAELRDGDRLQAGVLAFQVQAGGGRQINGVRSGPDSTEAIVLDADQRPPTGDGTPAGSINETTVCALCGMAGEWVPPARVIGDRAVSTFRCPGGHVWDAYSE